MNDLYIILLCIVLIIIALSVLYSMPSAFLKEFEKSCHEAIKKQDEKFEEKEKLNKALKQWLFH